jgi:maleate cis-trans isomerase
MTRSRWDRIDYTSVRRFGVIAPSVNTVVEPEFYSLGLKDATFHFVRARNREGSVPEELRAMTEEALEVAVNLADARPEYILFACTSGSLFEGVGFDHEVAEAITRRVSIPAATTATAAIDALKRLGVSRIGLGTPYLDWLGQAEVRFLADSGIEAVLNENLGIKDGHVIAALRPADVRDLAFAVDTPEAEAIFLSCTDLPTYGIVGELESQLGKPVVSSNTAGIWALLGSDTRLANLGRLFEAAGAVAAR